ncbi:MAG: hypothetical protein FWE01_00415 [Firmicutes bacterium]|nr:hypothetical protein [Bacillota bacterium]
MSQQRTRFIVYGVVFAALIGLMIASVFMFRDNNNSPAVFGGTFEADGVRVHVEYTYTFTFYLDTDTVGTPTGSGYGEGILVIEFDSEDLISAATINTAMTTYRTEIENSNPDRDYTVTFEAFDATTMAAFLNQQRTAREDYSIVFTTTQVRYVNHGATTGANANQNRRQVVFGDFEFVRYGATSAHSRGFFTLINAENPGHRTMVFDVRSGSNVTPERNNLLFGADETSMLSTCRQRVFISTEHLGLRVDLVFAS